MLKNVLMWLFDIKQIENLLLRLNLGENRD